MNKLVSRNPIQRFQQGKKIVKAAGGWQSIKNAAKTTIGGLFPNIAAGYLTIKGVKKIKDDVSDYEALRKARKNNFSVAELSSEIDDLEKRVNATLQKKRTPQKEVKTVTKFSSSNRTPRQKISQQRVTQQKVQKQPKVEQPQQKIEEPQITVTPKEEQQITVTPKIETPNFGYRTDNKYEGNDFSDRLKGLGIRSNADLIDFGWRTQGDNYDWKGDNWAKQFRSDINQALGGDWSDANIRNTFNIRGNWGRGFLGGGDISDFQKALQTNAGTWNGRYDQKKTDFINSQPIQDVINNYFAGTLPSWKNYYNKMRANYFPTYYYGQPLQSNFQPKLYYSKQGGQLISNNPIQRFKSGGLSPFGKAFKEARQQGLKTFQFNGKMYTTETKEEAEVRKKQKDQQQQKKTPITVKFW